MAPLAFSDGDLANLTRNIEKKMENGAPKEHGKPGKSNARTSSGLIRPKESASQGRSQPTEIRGKKRSRDGREKANVPVGNAIDDLAEDVRALGGDDDDLALIENVDSVSEYEGPAAAPKGDRLAKDLKSFIKQLGLKDNIPSDEEDLSEGSEKPTGSDIPAESRPLEKKAPLIQQNSKAGAPQGNGRLLFDPQAEWYSRVLPSIPDGSAKVKAVSPQTLERLHDYAKELLEAENQLYASRNISSSSKQFYSTIMTSGTLSDKTSALTLSVQESPLHNMGALEQLIKLARKRSRSQAVDVLGALKDLFAAGSVLPPDRRLHAFVAQPGLGSLDLQGWDRSRDLPPPLQETYLLCWAFEDWLKSMYFEIVKILEVWCNDQVTFARAKAVEYVFELLRDRPEQEVNLLRLLVNKLGDSEKKIASKASYNLLQLQKPHPKMKRVIISSIESDILFRPNQSMHAKYYAVITLNQTVLGLDEEDTVRKLLDIYFTLFLNLLSAPEPLPETKQTYNKKGERQGGGSAPGRMARKKAITALRSTAADDQLKERMISAILTGVNRAFPFTSSNDDFFEKHMDTLFKVTHSSNFNTGVQALMLIQQLATFGNVDRFYRTLYESLLDPRLLTTSKHTLYLNLLFRAVKGDSDLKRVKAFAKRMLQAASLHSPSVVCAILYMLRELEKASPSIHTLLDQPEDADDDDQSRAYDAKKRDPQFSNAEASCLWEIMPFLGHFHPSASLFASRLLDNAEMPPKPDLTMHSLANFLDHFVKQNPKKSHAGPRGSSYMQPLTSGDQRTLFVPVGDRADGTAFTSENFWRKGAEKVDPSEAFFHKYYSMRAKRKEGTGNKKKKKLDRKHGSDSESEEADEEEIWKALVDSRPELEQDDEDADMDDLESAMEDDEDQQIIEDEGEDGEGELGLDEDMEDVLGEDDEVPESEDAAALATPAELLDKGAKRRKKQKFRHLPTFALAEDYADMLEDDDAS